MSELKFIIYHYASEYYFYNMSIFMVCKVLSPTFLELIFTTAAQPAEFKYYLSFTDVRTKALSSNKLPKATQLVVTASCFFPSFVSKTQTLSTKAYHQLCLSLCLQSLGDTPSLERSIEEVCSELLHMSSGRGPVLSISKNEGGTDTKMKQGFQKGVLECCLIVQTDSCPMHDSNPTLTILKDKNRAIRHIS